MDADRERSLREKRAQRILADPKARMARITGATQGLSPDAPVSLRHTGHAETANALADTPNPAPAAVETLATPPTTTTMAIPQSQAPATAPTLAPAASSTSPSPVLFTSAPKRTQPPPKRPLLTSVVSLARLACLSLIIAASALAGFGILRFMPIFGILILCHAFVLWRANSLSLTFRIPAGGGGLAQGIALIQQFSSVYRLMRAAADDMFVGIFVAVLAAEASFLLAQPSATPKQEL